MTTEDLQKLRLYAELTNTVEKYVYLREDEKGKYIEYAFKKGAPHDNRCLSWYDSYQEKAYIRNKWIKDINDPKDKEFLDIIKKKRDKRVNEIFELSSFTCGHEEYPESSLKESEESWIKYHPNLKFIPEDHVCKVGCPAPNCIKNGMAVDWTYEEPVKCACWFLHEVVIPKYVSIPIEIVIKLENEIKKAMEE